MEPPKLTERLKKTKGLVLLVPYKSKNKEKEPSGPTGWCKRAQGSKRCSVNGSSATKPTRHGHGSAGISGQSQARQGVEPHTAVVYFCQQAGLSPLSFAELLAD